ncbi:MAG: M3 family oligoendopeptidase, partial [Deltaproteobacteria bacterium]|nr:M3 family oligoendopeptidase [Deltaproteobacteria bacterium]
MTTNEKTICWDLTPLYASLDAKGLQDDLAAAHAQAEAFREQYHHQVNKPELTASRLAVILHEYQDLQRLILKPYLYAQLQFAADSRPAEHGRLMARVREAWQRVSEKTLFFELELLQLEEQQFAHLIDAPQLAEFRHYLQTTRAHAPYTLSEAVEQALKRKDLSGRDAFVQLFDELTSSLTYRFQFPGEDAERDAAGEELLGMLYHGDGEVRERAFATFLDTHGDQALVLASCFNNIVLDHGKEADLRGYPDLMTPTHLSSETTPEMVEHMLATTETHYGLAQDYFALKKTLLGLERFKNTDLYAPVANKTRKFSFEEAWGLVQDAFGAFDPRLVSMTDRLLDQGRIDLKPQPGKSGGAFCMSLYPGADPYVLLNFTGTLRDVTTLAHELGHALHAMLASDQNLLQYHAPLPMAETASVFAEMLVTRHLLDQESDRSIKVALLCAKLEEVIATTFRQTVLTRFEQAAHARRAQDVLSSDELCELWLQENRRLFGDTVEMIPAYRWGWSYISHFIHARFYCYSYV